MINIMLSGCNGKMGQVITKIVSENEKIVAGIDINTEMKNDYPVFKSPYDFKEKADVIIDFSHPSCLEGLLKYATEKNTPIVIATTGLIASQIEQIKSAATKIPVFFSANMSLGVNLIIDLVSKAAKVLEGSFDIEIIEKHHNQKIDAPSGTALAIADSIANSLSYKSEYIYDRHSSRKKRSKNEIGIHAVRGGTIVGEHEVIFAGNDEIIEIKHSAMSKEIFAVGSISAAKFLVGQKKGLYNMKDLVSSM